MARTTAKSSKKNVGTGRDTADRPRPFFRRLPEPVTLVLILASLVYCAGLFTGLDNWGRGDWDQFSFRYETPRRALLEYGEPPLWNPYVGGGNVLAAHPHCPVFSPWYLPTLVFGAPLGLRLTVLMMTVIGALGVSKLLKCWDVSPAGRFVGGVLLMMSAHLACHTAEGHVEWLAIALIPWVIWCLIRAADDLRFLIVGAFLFASALGFGAIYVPTLFGPAILLWICLEAIRTGRYRPIWRCISMFALATVISAVVLLPRVTFVQNADPSIVNDDGVEPDVLTKLGFSPNQVNLYQEMREKRVSEGKAGISKEELKKLGFSHEQILLCRQKNNLRPQFSFDGINPVELARLGFSPAQVSWYRQTRRLRSGPWQDVDPYRPILDGPKTVLGRTATSSWPPLFSERFDADGNLLRLGEIESYDPWNVAAKRPRVIRIRVDVSTTADWTEVRLIDFGRFNKVAAGDPITAFKALDNPKAATVASVHIQKSEYPTEEKSESGELPATIDAASSTDDQYDPFKAKNPVSSEPIPQLPRPAPVDQPKTKPIESVPTGDDSLLEDGDQIVRKTVYFDCLPLSDSQPRIEIVRGDMGRTDVRIVCQDRTVFKASHDRTFAGDPQNLLTLDFPSSQFSETPGGPRLWAVFRAKLWTDSQWSLLRVKNAPYLFEVQDPRAEASERQPTEEDYIVTESLSIHDQKNRDQRSVRHAILLLPYLDDDPIVFSLFQAIEPGNKLRSGFTLETLDGTPIPLDAGKVENRGASLAVRLTLDPHVLQQAKPVTVRSPLRWRLDRAGMSLNWQEYACYITLLGFGLAVIGIVSSYRRHWPMFVVALVALVFAFGSGLPVDFWAFRSWLPLYGSLQVSGRLLSVVVFVLSISAAFGLDLLVRRLGRRKASVSGNRESAGRSSSRFGTFIGWTLAIAIFAELSVLSGRLFNDVFVCPPREMPGAADFAPRYATDYLRYSTQYSAMMPLLDANSGVLRHYENIIVPQGDVRLAGKPGFRGEVYLTGKESGSAVEIENRTMRTVTARLPEITAPTRLVFNQNFFKGWRAKIESADGKTRTVRAVASPGERVTGNGGVAYNGLVSVEVRPGDVRVEFYYSPTLFWVGLWTSIIAIGLCVFALIRWTTCVVWAGCVRGFFGRLWIGTRDRWRRLLPDARLVIGGLLEIVAISLPFILCRPSSPWVTADVIRVFAVGGALLLFPGLAIFSLLMATGQIRRWNLIYVIATSLALFIVIVVVARLFGCQPSANVFWFVTLGVTIAATAAARLLGGRPWFAIQRPGRAALTGIAVGLVALVVATGAARSTVPPMIDHDLEVQGTAFSLLTRLSPEMLTDRGTRYYFAHPPLLHFVAAGSILYYDRLDDVKYYDDALQRSAAEPETTVAETVGTYDTYLKKPLRLETRTPNIIFTALTIGLLTWWVVSMTGRVGFSLLSAATYFTTIEVFVRGAYGGYFAPSNFLVLVMLLSVGEHVLERSRGTRGVCFVTGLLAALFNHKLILLPIAIGIWMLVRKEGFRRAVLHPIILGFATGSLLFALYGFSISPAAFMSDHWRTHLVDRLVHSNPLGYGGYLGPLSLWGELFAHTGYLLLPATKLALLVMLWTKYRQRNSQAFDPANLLDRSVDSARARLLLQIGLCAVWIVITSLVFTWIDWRQTKHLTPLLLLPPLILARFVAEHRRWLVPVVILLLIVLAIDLDQLRRAAEYFEIIRITPAW